MLMMFLAIFQLLVISFMEISRLPSLGKSTIIRREAGVARAVLGPGLMVLAFFLLFPAAGIFLQIEADSLVAFKVLMQIVPCTYPQPRADSSLSIRRWFPESDFALLFGRF